MSRGDAMPSGPHAAFPIAFDAEVQARLEATVPLVGQHLAAEPMAWRAKSPRDEELAEDLAADQLWRACAESLGASYLSEELGEAEWDRWRARLLGLGTGKSAGWRVLVADPIDGSSEWHRTGWRHSPVTTAAMVLDLVVEPGRGLVTRRVSGRLVAAVAGDIWQRRTFCLAGRQLVVRDWDRPAPYTIVRVSPEKRRLPIREAMTAAYFPHGPAVAYLEPLFEAVPYLHNNSGIRFALRVVEGQSSRSYALAIEPKPVDFWEHVGVVLAAFGGASVSRLDGSPLTLNPFAKQSSIAAASRALREACVELLQPACKKYSVQHLHYWLNTEYPIELGKKL